MKKKVINNLIKRFSLLRKHFFYTHTYEGIYLQSMLLHKNVKGFPERLGTITEDIMPTPQDTVIVKRLLKAYKMATEDTSLSKHHDLWTLLSEGHHSKFLQLLKDEDVDGLSFMLCNMARFPITEGLVQGKSEYEKISKLPTYRRWATLAMADKLVSLAEALGVIPYENPEQGIYGEAIWKDINQILKKIEDHLQISIIPPNIEGGLYKLVTNEGGIHSRDITSVYTAWRCKEILRDIHNPKICEIGGGLGKVAYFSYLMGIDNFTLIDLPHINVLQGYFLLKSLPKANMYLFGEKQNYKKPHISILPDFSFKKFEKSSFNLTLNQDSFPEIDKTIVKSYLGMIKKNTSDYFLSINQESQNTMMSGNKKQHITKELVKTERGYKQVYRFPYWVRAGYIEELYKITI